jgi:endonuclease/exonuclease/phosphatase (EEP) superfamily protein YafD
LHFRGWIARAKGQALNLGRQGLCFAKFGIEIELTRAHPTNDLIIISWNLLHTGGATVEQVGRLIEEHDPDLFLMQEATAQIDVLPDRAGGHYSRVALPGRHHGLAAWSKRPLRTSAANLQLQRGLIVERICQILELDDITVSNVHLSHGQALNRLQLRRVAQALPRRAAILGDCNLVGSPFLPGFRDVGPRQATHWAANMIALRLDRCFVRGLACNHAQVLGRGASDHWPIMVALEAPRPAAHEGGGS